MIPPLVKRMIGQPVLMYRRRELRRFLNLLPQLEAVQRGKLQMILASMQGSAFAKDFRLRAGMTPRDLQQALPIAGFERVAPYVERLMDGETTALFAPGTSIRMMARTSGTTAAAKHIPVTAAAFDEYRRSWTVWGCAVANDHPKVPFGGVLNLASPWQEQLTGTGLPIGSISGLLVSAMHGTMRLINAVPPAAVAVADAEKRWYLALRLALMRPDIRMVTTANPSTLVAFAQMLDRDKEFLIRDLRDGSLRHEDAYPSVVVATLRPRLRIKQRQRAQELERLAVAPLTPRMVWPGLELLGVWTGGTLAPYLSLLPTLFGPVAWRDHGLSASEGRFTIPLADGLAHGVLNGDGAFFEFLPEDQAGMLGGVTKLAHELAAGCRYSLVVTTSGGLVRYDMGDIVECRGFYRGAPLLAFLNKGAHVASITGEKLSAYQVVAAMRQTMEEIGLRCSEFVVAPLFGTPAHYVLILERSVEVPPQLASVADRNLCLGNTEYADKRRSGRLGMIVVKRVADGAFARRRAAKLRGRGGSWEQYKHPYLIPDLSCEPEFGSFD